MSLRLQTLRHDDTCARCATLVPARSTAWWDRYAGSVVCVICEPVRLDDPLPPPEIERAMARAANGRTPSDAERIEIHQQHGPGLVGRVMRLLADDPSPATAPAIRADGERRLARLLDTELTDAVTLHDRTVPLTRGALDHLVIASSGIWLIDAKRHPGDVQCRLAGSRSSGEARLYVNGRNQTRLVHALGWQVASVRAQLETIGFGEVPVHPVVCFTSSQWGRSTSPFEVHGVLVTWPSALVDTIRRPGKFDGQLIELVAGHLSATLVSASSTSDR